MATVELDEVVDRITINKAIALLGTKTALGRKWKVKRIIVAVQTPQPPLIISNAHRVKMELNTRGQQRRIMSFYLISNEIPIFSIMLLS